MKLNKMAVWLCKSFVITCLLSILAVGTVQAAPLGIQLVGSPDIFSIFITVIYNAGTETLTASGITENIDGVAVGGAMTFDISANILNSGAVGPGGGTLSILGTVGSPFNFASGTILASTNLLAFGFQDGGPIEFAWGNLIGDAAPLFPTGGLDAATILNSDTGCPPVCGFGADFDNVDPLLGFGAAAANTLPTPEPGTALLMLTGLAGLYGLRKRSRVKKS